MLWGNAGPVFQIILISRKSKKSRISCDIFQFLKANPLFRKTFKTLYRPNKNTFAGQM